MSSRHVRRTHQHAPPPPPPDHLASPSDCSDSSSDDLPRLAPANAFGALQQDEPSASDAEDDEAPDPPAAAAAACRRRVRPSRHAPVDEDELITAAMAEAAKAAAARREAEEARREAEQADPWRLDAAHLEVSNELSRKFGKSTLKMLAAAERAEGRRAARPKPPAGARKLRGGSLLVKPRDGWAAWSGGVGMEIDSSRRDDAGATWFVFTYSAAYRQSERGVHAAVESADPAQLQQVLQHWPYQLDALLRLAEYTTRTAQHELSSELVEKALFAFQSALHPLCKLTHGRARLSFTHPPNQLFYIALFRQMTNLGRRGCYRTAMEVARLLLSLDPTSDPLNVLLHLNFYALSAHEPRFVMSLPLMLPNHGLQLYPQQAFAAALAAKQLEQPDADERLERALLLFPAVLPRLLPRVSPATAAHESDRLVAQWRAQLGETADQASGGRTLCRLQELFVERHAPLWRDFTKVEWIANTATRLLRQLEAMDEEVDIRRRLLGVVRDSTYGGAARDFDEFADADVADFRLDLPAQLPDDEDAPHQPARWPAHARAPRLPGRLVVPREERLQLQRGTNPLLQFFLSLLPWAMPPPPPPHRG
ncbi:hypothetical protein AB1Y20_000023 [Prymnesium parvum]|uniref:Transcription factor 25 n=1 Tax=Prymnesium parvum TaxID=97485 RepID=A0AB34K8S5_PRYPA